MEQQLPPDDPKLREAQARVEQARAAEKQARDRAVASSGNNAMGEADRKATETAMTLKGLRARRAQKEAEVKKLDADAKEVVFPEVAPDGGVWVNRAGRRPIYALAAAVIGGLAAGFVGWGKRR